MHEALVNRLGGISLPRKSVVRLIDRPDMTLDVYRGRKTAIHQIDHCYRSAAAKANKVINEFLQDNENIRKVIQIT